MTEPSMTVTEQLSELHRILTHGDISTLFQPILSIYEQRILGYEALSRGPLNSPLHAPIPLFSVACHTGCLSDLEHLCWANACQRFHDLGIAGQLFLYVSTDSLLDPENQCFRILELLKSFDIPPHQVVIELIVHTPIVDFAILNAVLRHYRAVGFSIALAARGAGYSSLRLWSELRPDYVKIDHHFIEAFHQDPVKQEFIRSILKMAKASRAEIIAEGIECAEELDTLMDIGIDLVQGDLFARPTEQPSSDFQQYLHLPPVKRTSALAPEGEDLTALLIDQPGVLDTTPVAKVMDLFQAQPALLSLAVIDDRGHPVGIVHRHALFDALLKPFGADLFARKAICRLMSDNFLGVEQSLSLQQVSRLLTSRARQRIEEDFVITRDGYYQGLGRVIDVLKLITEQNIQQARYANPLTLLPGNVPIQQSLTRLLNSACEALVCYVDIDHFKPFNDCYGYAKGDEVLLSLSQCLSRQIDPRCDFLGHIGGDDFLLVLTSPDWPLRLRHIQEDFQAQCRRYYSSEHLKVDSFTAYDRQGRPQEFPLLSLSLGAVRVFPETCAQLDAAQLAELASIAKQQSKKVGGNSLQIIDTRTRTPQPA